MSLTRQKFLYFSTKLKMVISQKLNTFRKLIGQVATATNDLLLFAITIDVGSADRYFVIDTSVTILPYKFLTRL